MAKKKIYRTTIQMIVLSEEPLSEGMSFEEIDANCDDGDFCGKTEWLKVNEVLEGREAAIAVEDTGSDPEFFQMDKDGNELEEE
jgi:hypothetical protein